MPDPTPSAISTPLSQLPAQAVHERFSTRPALFSVVFNALRERILERYPALNLDLLNVKLASPSPSGGWTLQPLMSVAINHVLNPQLLDMRPRRELPFYLTQQLPRVLDTPNPPHIDMQVIAQIIDELPSALYVSFQQALADYWSEVDSQGSSRWQWLGEFLNGQMTAAAAGLANLTPTQRDMLSIVAAWPERLERLFRSTPTTYAYFIETTLIQDGQQVLLLSPDLLLVRDRQVLLYGLAGTIETFDSIDAFSDAWGARLQRQFEFDSITWKRNEPDGNVFEQQAGLVLNQQLEDLKAFKFQDQSDIVVERRLDKLTDPALLFTKVPEAAPTLLQKVNNQLPQWLRQADATDRFTYHRHLQAMAQVLKQNQGRSFNEGIEDIHSFSRDALREQMHKDHADYYDPDDVELDFAIATGYPDGAGIIDHVRMSLTELALKNLAGKPKGTLTLSSKSGKKLPHWLNVDYLLGSQGLIQRVDIGTAYPQRIKDVLLSDTVDARRRETLFTRELKVRLPMQALEYKLENQHGVSAKGYRYVAALMDETSSDRIVDAQEIVLRPLAFYRKPGAAPDTAEHMFIIEPRDTRMGPHLLYRPLYPDSLHEYPTRQALLDVIATPGDVQNSVLTWLTDKARPVYDHGGFKEPHIVHFGAGDEFGPYEKPAPATLAVDEGAEEWLQSQANGSLLSHLFGSTARALVDLADRDSVSNSESRWAIVMEGAWLLFNTLLLPLVRGPAMLAGWFLVLVGSLEQDLAGLDSDDSTTRELALIDLLLNTAMVLLHAARPSNRTRQPLAEPAPQDNALHLAAWRRQAGVPHPLGAPVVRQGAVALPGEPMAAGHTALDFSRSIASPSASRKLLTALLEFQVPWPESLPNPAASGPFKGLYRIRNLWHASVGGLLFQTRLVPGFGEVYLVDPNRPLHPGFKLASDGQGHWRLDRGARLEGGMRRSRLKALREENQNRKQALNDQIKVLQAEETPLDLSVETTADVLEIADRKLNEQTEILRPLWLSRVNAIEAQRETIAARHEQQQSATARAKLARSIAFDNFHKAWLAYVSVSGKIIDLYSELMTVDRTGADYGKKRGDRVMFNFDTWARIYDNLGQDRKRLLQTERGESYGELKLRFSDELSKGITSGYQEFFNIGKAMLELIKRQAEPAKTIETLLEQADPIQRARLLKAWPETEWLSTAAQKQHELVVYSEQVMDRSSRAREPAEYLFITWLKEGLLGFSVIAHMEMRARSGYTAAERIAVLKNVLEQYEHTENAVNSLTEMGSGYIRAEYRAPFLESLDVSRSDVEEQLATLIKIEEGLVPAPAPVEPQRSRPPKKVVNTSDNRTLVGDLRPRRPEDPGRIVDITNPISGQTATYLEHADEGVWVEVVPARPAEPVSAPVVRSLESIKQQANTIIAQRAGIERTIRAQQKKLKDPGRREDLTPLDWNDMLIQHADKLNALVEEIRRDHSTDPAAVGLGETYLDEANAATALAREVCSEGYKQQLPKAVNIAYLWKYGFVDINLVRSRVSIKTGDYLTEYVVRERNTLTVLWYAHFHYVAVDTPASQYSFGHLKLPAQRYLTRKQLIERAIADNRAVVNLNKSVIARPLAEQLFLGLEPPLPDAD